MAELEAITEIPYDPKKSLEVSGQYGRRFPLAPNQKLNLGRDQTTMDVAVPDDDQISRFQAVLTWDPVKEKLTVQTRAPAPPSYPHAPANQTLIFDDRLKRLVEVPQGTCVVGYGESFWIGQTKFTVLSDDDPAADGADAKVSSPAFRLPDAPPSGRIGTDQALFRRMLRTVMEAMPRADAAAIVRIPPDCPADEQRLALLEFNVRPKTPHAHGGFAPSKALAYRAIVETRKTCRMSGAVEGTSGPRNAPTATDTQVQGLVPWAVCTPFQEGPYALYVAGQTSSAQWNVLPGAGGDRIDDLTQYQKVAEVVVEAIETAQRHARLTRQAQVLRRAWPKSLWRYLEDDPADVEQMLIPEEKEITTLFCDLRNYSLFASQNAGQLLPAQKAIQNALNTMASAIADRDGVVGGFRGDAVLGFWGWPKPQEWQVARAARAALAIVGRIGDEEHIGRCGVAITHGTAVAGRLGAHDLAVVDLYGPVVNLTFRLEAMTKAFGVPIIVAQEVVDLIETETGRDLRREVRTRPLGKVRAKGFPAPVWAHELYAVHTPSVPDRLREGWVRAVTNFTGGRWREACEALAHQFPHDPAAHCLLRVMAQTQYRPPGGWDGSFVPLAPPDPE